MPGGGGLPRGGGGGKDVRIDRRPILFDCFLSFYVSWIPIKSLNSKNHFEIEVHCNGQ